MHDHQKFGKKGKKLTMNQSKTTLFRGGNLKGLVGESRPVLYSVVWGVKICICVDFGFKATCGWNVIHHDFLRNQPCCEVGKASRPRAEVKQQETRMNRNIYKGQRGKLRGQKWDW